MRLGLILSSATRFHFDKIPYRFRGKYRIVKQPSLHDLYKMKIDFEREEQNMLVLRHPYLTIEQSHGHTKALYNQPEEFLNRRYDKHEAKFAKHVTFAERLSHLGYGEQWD